MGERFKTPLMLQMEAVECGPAALGSILAYYGKYVPLEDLRFECGVTRDGVKALNMVKAAKRFGLKATGLRMEMESVAELKAPCILYWEFRHFVVFEGTRDGEYYINDPSIGYRVVSESEFDKSFTGVVLAFSPDVGFQPSGRRFSLRQTIRRWMRGTSSPVAFLILAGLTLVLPGIVIPTLARIFVDNILIKGFHHWLWVLLLSLASLGLLRSLLEWLKRLTLSKLQEKVVARAASEFLLRTLRLPMRFFSQRSAGELASRLSIADALTGFFAKDAPDAVLEVISLVFFSALMLTYNAPLTAMAWFAATLSVALFYCFAHRLGAQQMIVQQEQGKATGFLVQAISMLETIKLRADERDVLQCALENRARVINAEQKMNLLRSTSAYASDLLRMLSTSSVYVVGGMYVLESRMTLGELIAFQALMTSFMLPIGNLLRFATAYQEMGALAKRVEDVSQYPIESVVVSPSGAIRPWTEKLTSLQASSLCFGYSNTDPCWLKDISFRVQCQQAIAFVGKTGSGKSTIAKLICGLYKPWTGQILFDGVADADIPAFVRHQSIAFVDQNICLFEGTVRDNLSFWNPAITEEALWQAAADACIDDVISSKPNRLDHRLEENGRNFSGGERQRLEIARALAMNPTILVMDEATSALDPTTESRIVTNLKRRGCACIFVAHRLSTVRDCDEIVFIDNGAIIDRGHHEELMLRCVPYRMLVNHD